jgi:hypothetical protein
MRQQLAVRWALIKVLLSRDPHHTLRTIVRHEMREHADRLERAMADRD